MSYINSLFLIGIWITIVLLAGVICKSRWPNQNELSRKLIHICIGPVIPMAWWLQIPSSIAIPVAAAITLGLILNQRLNFLSAIETNTRKSYGTIAYGLTITILLVLFWPEKASAVCAGVLVMAFGDGLAGLIGKTLQSPSWIIWGQKKSVIGTLTMFLMSLIPLVYINQISESGVNLIEILAITVLAVIIEQISKFGLDNISVPLSVALCWSVFAN